MKLNSTIGLTLVLLASMLIAGIFSAVAGMSLGREALKGITQPDTRPTNNLANRKGDAPRKNELTVLQEDQIITKVKARMGGKITEPAPKAFAAKSAEPQSKLPISVKNEGVFLEVKSVQSQGDSLVLQMSLKNETAEPIKFLYSFLEIKDDQGRILSASTEGLPSELPPDNELYSGTVRIPITSIDKAQNLSLALSDYPDQQVQLKLPNIPVSR
ncbi:MAG: hypothetical protein IGS48_13255 [Oscillatoriales cyanobacterium C42_A2020_001]|nr:hypothetical protein [Leptolyngbyaceae cyanobacterium C42_A2020_001]